VRHLRPDLQAPPRPAALPAELPAELPADGPTEDTEEVPRPGAAAAGAGEAGEPADDGADDGDDAGADDGGGAAAAPGAPPWPKDRLEQVLALLGALRASPRPRRAAELARGFARAPADEVGTLLGALALTGAVVAADPGPDPRWAAGG